jgi:hypothetical protein
MRVRLELRPAHNSGKSPGKKSPQCEIGYILRRRRFLYKPGCSRPPGGNDFLGSLALATSGANAYQSRANGTQAYPNPDRETYVNRSCCSWKTNHKAPHKVVKH